MPRPYTTPPRDPNYMSPADVLDSDRVVRSRKKVRGNQRDCSRFNMNTDRFRAPSKGTRDRLVGRRSIANQLQDMEAE